MRGKVVGNDCGGALAGDGVAQTFAVIGRVGHDDFGGEALDQGVGLWGVAFLAGGDREADRAAEATHGHVDLRAQAATGPAEGLILSPRFAPEAC